MQIDGGIFAAPIDLQLEIETVTFVEGVKPGALDCTDVHERIGLTIIALNEAEAFHGVEEFDRTTGAFARKLTLRRAATLGCTTKAACTRFAWGCAIGHRERFALDFQIRRRNLAAAIDEGEAQRLSFGKADKACLFDRADVNKHVFGAIIAHDKAEALLRVEEFYDAGAFTDDLCRHAATRAAPGTRAAATEPTAAASTATKAAAILKTAAASTAAKAATILKATTKPAAARFWKPSEAIFAETVPLVLAASAATSIKTHALLVTFASSNPNPDEHVGRRDMQDPP